MVIPASLQGALGLPAIVAPMFLTSGSGLVVEVCRSGLTGTFPALNQCGSRGYADLCQRLIAECQAAGPAFSSDPFLKKHALAA